MFTIKWVAPGGHERLYFARGVQYVPVRGKDKGRSAVEFNITGQSSDVEGDSRCSIDNGRVYVMNQNGKTVADYSLGDVV